MVRPLFFLHGVYSIRARRKLAVWQCETKPKPTAYTGYLTGKVSRLQIGPRNFSTVNDLQYAIYTPRRMIRQNFPQANTTGFSIRQCFPCQKLKIANSLKFFPARILRYTVICRGVGSSFGLIRQLNIDQANVPGWAGCTMATMLKMTNF